jgi:FkbM family methyltransferase
MRRLWRGLVRRLDRPGRRWLLVVPGSLWVTASYRSACVVYWHDGAWIHHYRDAKIPHAVLGRAAPPSVFTAEARDLFLYDYEPRPGDVVFDVGAGTGADTLVFSRLVGKAGRVVSLEAHPRTYARLVSLCNANRLDNVIPLQVAAADTDGELSISDSEQHVRNTVLGDGDIQVTSRRIDSVARELGIDHVDLLKMNIEGAERLAIEGLDGIIDKTRNVCIGCHDFIGVPTKKLVRDFLLERGFRVTTREDAPDPWTRDYVYGSKS